MAEANVLNHKYLCTSLALHAQTHKCWLQGCAASLPSTPHLVLYLHTLQTEHSSTSIPNISPTLPQEWLPKLSVQLKQHKYIHTSHTDFHVIQVTVVCWQGKLHCGCQTKKQIP